MNDLAEWILCPRCHQKTRVKVRPDTVLERFPLFCPKCKANLLISVRELKVNIVDEPDANMTQSR